jgi:1-acyl-sn-glycerol-3-phosphate acyltransferase
VLLGARDYLRKNCSVIFFPEGTRSRDGSVGSFNEGAFRLAIKEQVPILPLVVEGTRDALPRDNWRFGPVSVIRLGILPPIETAGLTKEDTQKLTQDVREQIIRQIDAWREPHPNHGPA